MKSRIDYSIRPHRVVFRPFVKWVIGSLGRCLHNWLSVYPARVIIAGLSTLAIVLLWWRPGLMSSCQQSDMANPIVWSIFENIQTNLISTCVVINFPELWKKRLSLMLTAQPHPKGFIGHHISGFHVYFLFVQSYSCWYWTLFSIFFQLIRMINVAFFRLFSPLNPRKNTTINLNDKRVCAPCNNGRKLGKTRHLNFEISFILRRKMKERITSCN